MATALLLTVSALPVFVRAQGGTTLSVTPGQNSGELGEHFTVHADVADVPSLVAYNIVLSYDTRILSVDSATLGGTLFDVNQNGDISDDPVLVARAEVLEGLGLVRYTVGLFGSAPITVVGSAPLLHVSFVVESLGASPIAITESSLAVFTGSSTEEQPHDTMDGEYRTAAGLMLSGQGCRGITQGRDRDRVQLMCTATNIASVPIDVAAEFAYQSDGGQSGTARTSTVTLAPGDARTILVRTTVLPDADSFDAQGTVFRVVMSPDGFMDIEGPTDSFSFDTGR